MKYIILGLGNFGASLSEKLTAQGNEVIGIDNRMERVEAYKERVSHTICMDATDEYTVQGLPLKDTDVVIIAIGEDQGANVMATALFKNLKVKRLISRAINPLHEKVLLALGVDEIVHPEQETAERWAKKLCITNVVDSFELSEDFSIVEATVPKEYIGQTIGDLELRVKYHLLVLTIISKQEEKSLVGNKVEKSRVQGVVSPSYELKKDEIMVLFGSNNDLNAFLKENQED
ncbi:MAG: TrkA family potassium uptake protein [Cytophagia bacterium]|nr:TrkA family potassium uptake protein [Cytophagia bacterium]